MVLGDHGEDSGLGPMLVRFGLSVSADRFCLELLDVA